MIIFSNRKEKFLTPSNDDFTSNSDLKYLTFGFYSNTREQVNTFKRELVREYEFILGFTEVSKNGGIEVRAYVKTSDDIQRMKNEYTKVLYMSFVGTDIITK